jgi:hypothetical protein
MEQTAIVTHGSGIPDKIVRAEIRKQGYRIVNKNDGHVTIIFAYHIDTTADLWSKNGVTGINYWDPLAYGPCLVKNLINGKTEVCSKDLLHKNLQGSRYIAETSPLSDIVNVTVPLIIRPAGRQYFSGKDIYIVTNNSELKVIKEYWSSKEKVPSLIASEYIRDPYLINGYKFHFRVYYLFRLPRNRPMSYKILLNSDKIPYCDIFTAGQEFKLNDFSNKMIHDTHSRNAKYNYVYPDDENLISPKLNALEFKKQLEDIGDLLLIILKKSATNYPEVRLGGFETFVADIMVRNSSKLNTVVLEVNDNVGFRWNRTGELGLPTAFMSFVFSEGYNFILNK